MTKELTIVNPAKFDELINEAGLEIKEGEQIKQSYIPFLDQLAQIQQQSGKINYENPTDIDENIAHDLRMKTVKIRTGALVLKDQRKKIYLLKGNLEQAAYNLIKSSCELAEESFVQVEKAKQIKEEKMKVERLQMRLQKLNEFEVDLTFVNVKDMTDEQFDIFYTQQYDLKIAKEQALAKIEAERIAKEKAEREENERIRIENEKLKKDVEEKERLAEIEHKKQAEILAKQKAESERLAKIEAEKQAKIQAELKTKADEQKRIADEKLKKEQAEKAKLEAELKAKKEAELKAKKEIEEKEKARIEAQKKAEKAPDKEKLNKWVNEFSIPELSLKTKDAKQIEIFIREKFDSFKFWSKKQIENI